MKKLLGYILTPLTAIAFSLCLVIFHPLQWISFRVFGYTAHKKVVDILNLFLLRTFYLLGDTVTFINEQNLPVGRPIIFLANHQSLLDIPPLIYYLRKYHAKFVSKIELTKNIPSISYNLKHGGGANIDRKDQRQAMTELMMLGVRMKENNWSAVIFPEGTRSKDGTVKPFHSAGIAAILKKCPDALLVPIAINNAWKVMKYGYFPLNTFTAVTWTVLEPIEPGKTPVAELVLEAENRIKAALA
ncbi:lysophospholipid acyltransferase family protein [Mucilaginibacter kameinonensis]|uniref:lysophospholipid acyltransferase family protein n=1 Tax=Mucilaginibacter kameinonensis TaxID=452286 RepID=UPI000EF80BE0|nr:lysophospholipid acyltransferase family protein [Mucilaginibacter kameinonensis]